MFVLNFTLAGHQLELIEYFPQFTFSIASSRGPSTKNFLVGKLCGQKMDTSPTF